MELSERIAHGYFFAKKYIIDKGFGNEIDWQEELDFESITQQKFLEEISWVILASGMNDKVVKRIFPLIKAIMFDFTSCEEILTKKKKCYGESIKLFNHPGKINAILYIVEFLEHYSFEFVKLKIKNEGINFIQTFPFMGKATAFHLAKNIGLEVAKPDRHLSRMSFTLGFDNPQSLCKEIASQIDEKISLIDLVLWRYATLDRNYLRKINWLMNKKLSD